MSGAQRNTLSRSKAFRPGSLSSRLALKPRGLFSRTVESVDVEHCTDAGVNAPQSQEREIL